MKHLVRIVSSQSKPKRQSVPEDAVDCPVCNAIPSYYLDAKIQVYRKRDSAGWIKRGPYKPVDVLLCGDCLREGRQTVVAK